MLTKTVELEYVSSESTPPSVGVVIVAAGSASRMGGTNKILAPIMGRPVIYHTLLAFEKNLKVKKIVVVTKADLIPTIQNMVESCEFSKVTDIVLGGQCREASVKAGLDVLKSDDIKTVLIHDCARPLVNDEVINRVITAAGEFSAVAPAVPVKDTVKRVGPLGRVEQTVDRQNLVNIQTPQGFSAEVIFSAFEKVDGELEQFTDDASVVEANGTPVYTVMGDYKNIKITTPEDLALAEAYLKLMLEEL